MSSEQTFVVRDERRRGFFMVFNDFYDQYGSKLGPYGLAVYMALCRYANRESECWPSQRRIAEGTGMSRRQVQNMLQKLEDLELIAVERNGMSVNTYILLDPPACDAHPHAHDAHPPTHVVRTPTHKVRIPHARGAHKQDLSNKSYLPDELTEVIIR